MRKKQKKYSKKQKYSPPKEKYMAMPIAIRRPVRQKITQQMNFKNKELITSLYSLGSTPAFFAFDSFPINPGMPNTFPWLSQIAKSFDTYKINSMSLIYEPKCPTTYTGNVVMQAYSDATQTPSNELAQALLGRNSETTAVISPKKWNIPTSVYQGRHSRFLVRGPNTVVQSIQDFDAGILYIYLDTVSAQQQYGNLFIEYDITFSNPVYTSETGNSLGNLTAVQSPLNSLAYNYLRDAVNINSGTQLTIQQPGSYLLNLSDPFASSSLAVSTTNSSFDILSGSSGTSSVNVTYRILVTLAQAYLGAQLTLPSQRSLFVNLVKAS